MTLGLGLFLVLFWGGIVFIFLAAFSVVAISPWVVLLIWLVIMGIYLTAFILMIRLINNMSDEEEIMMNINKAENAGARMVAQYELEKEKRRTEFQK
jgi:hypothetical protein